MRALRHVWMLEKQEAGKALELLEKAIHVDPDYPLALALAAWCHAQQSVYSWVKIRYGWCSSSHWQNVQLIYPLMIF